jgi:hypothetical protein
MLNMTAVVQRSLHKAAIVKVKGTHSTNARHNCRRMAAADVDYVRENEAPNSKQF